jgi:hypothetical protein
VLQFAAAAATEKTSLCPPLCLPVLQQTERKKEKIRGGKDE